MSKPPSVHPASSPPSKKLRLTTATHDTSIDFGSFVPHNASSLPADFSPIKHLPISDQSPVEECNIDDLVLPDELQPVVEEGNPDDLTDADLTLLAEACREQNPTTTLTATIPPPPLPRPHTLTKPTLCAIISQSKNFGLLPGGGFTAIPSTTLGNTHPQNYSAFEQRTVEGQTGLLSRHCPVWSIRNWRATQRPSFEVLRMYQCKCKGCNFEMKVVRVVMTTR